MLKDIERIVKNVGTISTILKNPEKSCESQKEGKGANELILVDGLLVPLRCRKSWTGSSSQDRDFGIVPNAVAVCRWIAVAPQTPRFVPLLVRIFFSLSLLIDPHRSLSLYFLPWIKLKWTISTAWSFFFSFFVCQRSMWNPSKDPSDVNVAWLLHSHQLVNESADYFVVN